MGKKYVYLFKEGNANMRELLGGKGANLAEMTNLGLPIPQGFTITTEACVNYYKEANILENVNKVGAVSMEASERFKYEIAPNLFFLIRTYGKYIDVFCYS